VRRRKSPAFRIGVHHRQHRVVERRDHGVDTRGIVHLSREPDLEPAQDPVADRQLEIRQRPLVVALAHAIRQVTRDADDASDLAS
jgi:hypothetical protein